MLDENRQGFRDRGDRRLVPVIIMGMGDDHRINVNNRFAEKGSSTSGLRSSLRAVPGNPGQAPCPPASGQSETFSRIFNNLGRITDMGDVHDVHSSRLSGEHRTSHQPGAIWAFGQ
jgi:hypothetical protein